MQCKGTIKQVYVNKYQIEVANFMHRFINFFYY